MSDRSRDDEQGSDKASADPYGYLAAGGENSPGATTSYLPGEETAAPAGGNEITVGMTRRELREMRAKQAQQAEQATTDGEIVAGPGSVELAPHASTSLASPAVPSPVLAAASGDETTALPAIDADPLGSGTLGADPLGLAPSFARPGAQSPSPAEARDVPGSPDLGFGMPSVEDLDTPAGTQQEASSTSLEEGSDAAPVAAPYAALRGWRRGNAPDGVASKVGTDDAPLAGLTVPAIPSVGTVGTDRIDASKDPVAPGWHESAPPSWRRRLPYLIGAAVLVAALIGLVAFLGRNGDGRVDSTATPTATQEATGLSAILPATVEGGAFSETGKTGVTYSITADGLVTNPVPPAGATESLVGLYAGGNEAVTLTGSTFATTEEALAAATNHAATLGTPLETGPVFPQENLGTYWTFNNDGLVTMVWHDGGAGMFIVVSESAADAQAFYGGLEF